MKQLKWTTIVYYVDKLTGELLTKEEAKTYYEITKSGKHYEVNQHTKRGLVTLTKQCRPKQQQDLFRQQT